MQKRGIFRCLHKRHAETHFPICHSFPDKLKVGIVLMGEQGRAGGVEREGRGWPVQTGGMVL